MANITRGTKANGTTEFVDDTAALASEVNTDLNTIYNEFNGGIDETNLSGSIAIPNSALVTVDGTKVADHSDDAATAATATTPGDTATLASNLPTNLEEEIEALRYRIGTARGFTAATYYPSGGSATDVSWSEPPISGPNLIVNGGFEQGDSLTSTEAPTGWTLIGTPATTSIAAAATDSLTEGSLKRTFNWTTDGAQEGIVQTLTGLKTSTKYIASVRYFKNSADNFTLNITGAATSTDYENPTFVDDVASISTEYTTANVIFITGSTGPTVNVRIYSTDTSADMSIASVTVHELNEEIPVTVPHIPVLTATHDTAEALPNTTAWNAGSGGWVWETVGELALSQYVPCRGYRLVFECQLSWTNTNPGTSNLQRHGIRAYLDTGGGAAVVDGPYLVSSGGTTGVANSTWGQIATLKYYVDNPTPGLTYAFTVEVGGYNQSSTDAQLSLNPLINGVQSISRSWLRMEKL